MASYGCQHSNGGFIYGRGRAGGCGSSRAGSDLENQQIFLVLSCRNLIFSNLLITPAFLTSLPLSFSMPLTWPSHQSFWLRKARKSFFSVNESLSPCICVSTPFFYTTALSVTTRTSSHSSWSWYRLSTLRIYTTEGIQNNNNKKQFVPKLCLGCYVFSLIHTA